MSSRTGPGLGWSLIFGSAREIRLLRRNEFYVLGSIHEVERNVTGILGHLVQGYPLPEVGVQTWWFEPTEEGRLSFVWRGAGGPARIDLGQADDAAVALSEWMSANDKE